MSETLGKYELRHILGKGAMGTVYEGFDPIIARRLAIKTVRLPDAEDHEAQEELARFKREAQAAGRLSHPNIVGVFDYGETPEIAYIVMEFVDGTTLKHIVDKKERFELTEVVRLMEGVLAGLQYSHDRGVVHRDIKPANIMLTKAGEVKIADFGIARIESSSMTQAGTMLGTPSYMSPEQFMGQTVDSRTDLYSSGVMLYQLLTGEKPFEGGLTAIMHKVINTEPPPPSALSVTVPHAFDLVVQKAMAKRPEDRYATANDFAAALRSAVNAPAAGFGLGADELYGDGDATMVASSKPASRPAPPAAAPAAKPTPAAKKGPPIALIGGGVGALVVIGAIAAFLLMGHGSAPPAATPQPQTVLATPPPVVVPTLTPAQRQATLTGTLASLPCTIIAAVDNGNTPTLAGLAGAGAPAAALSGAISSLPAAITPVNNIQTIDGPYCDAMNAIRPYHNFFAATANSMGLTLKGGSTTLYNGQDLTIINTMPSFGGYLETDYFSSDGSVTHLFQPKPGDPAETPGSVKDFDAGTVAAPFGTDLIISIATASPLFTTQRKQVENASDYIPDLRTALQNAASAGEGVAVAAEPVVTMAKPAQ
jgi:serine/threonine-protein kinase